MYIMEIPVTPESPRKEEKKPPYSEKSINKQNEAKNFVHSQKLSICGDRATASLP